jgi:quercetin dioxygenase-like cupin family protein
MQKLSLDALARELVGQAAGGEKPGDSRVSRTVVGGHEKALRQTVIALAKDAALAEHASPGEATVLVLRGRVTLAAGAESWEGREGDLIIVPDAPHSLTAQADSAVLLTVVKRPLPARASDQRGHLGGLGRRVVRAGSDTCGLPTGQSMIMKLFTCHYTKSTW